MLNFTKKHSSALVDMNEQIAGVSEKYHAAVKKIERLEGELNQSYEAQSIISDSAKHCAASLYAVQNQLLAVVTHLDRSNKHISELMQENKNLKSSGDGWVKRAIKLEFDVLTAKDRLRKIENERNLAMKMCELLQAELMSADKENSRNSHRD